MKKILLISYFFPPIRGSGVQRRLKFAKYLPKFNWKPYLVTVKNISYYVSDNRLLNKLANEVEIYRTNFSDPLRISKLILDFFYKIIKLRKDKEIMFNKKAYIFKLYNILPDWFFLGDSTFLWAPFAYFKCCELIKKEKIYIILSNSTQSAYI